MSSTTFEDIFAFTTEALWDAPGGMNENTALAHDLQVAGLDGKEFMEKYAARFGVSLVGFDWVEYFGPEGTSPIGLFSYIYQRLIRRTPARELVEEPAITLGHLVKCANSGAWESPAQDRITSRSTRSRAKMRAPG